MERFDVVIIGQGYAGLVAAKLAAERGLRTASIEQLMPGGLVTSINELDPAPAGASACGPELTAELAMANMDNGVESVSSVVNSMALGHDNSWVIATDANEYVANNVIVASGARLRKLGVPGEQEFFGRGVSECADCDGPMYQGMAVVVVGGGDSAFQEALALTAYAEKVTIVMRGATPRAKAALVEQVAQNAKIAVLPNTQVRAILGEATGGVTGVRIQSADNAETTLPCSGVFSYIGLRPDSGYLPAEVNRDATGAVQVAANGKTNLPGLWAIGAVRSGFGGQLSDAAADAQRAVAALQ